MRFAVVFAAVAFALSSVPPAAAQTFTYDPGLFGPQKKAPNPPKVDWWRPFAEPAPAQAPKPSVICGMTVVPADPKVDPKMTVRRPDNGTKYTLKVVEPTVCKP